MATQNVRSSLTIPIFDPYDDTNLKDVMFMYERQPSILTNVGGHQFHNLTNYSVGRRNFLNVKISLIEKDINRKP
jgi:hypothetical protein